MKVSRTTATDIVVKRFGGLLKKLKGITHITSMLVLEAVKWLCPKQREDFVEADLNI